MYDSFSNDYDRFVNWQARLSAEIPFIRQQMASLPAHAKILDAACGTGMHTIALAQAGYQVSGADLSAGMIERARANSMAAGLELEFGIAGFGDLGQFFGRQQFSTLFCLGNSLPHVADLIALQEALADFAACLQPGGFLLLQNRNFDVILNERQRWMEPQNYLQGEEEWLFLRFYDFNPDGTIQFNILTLYRRASNEWVQRISSTALYPLHQHLLLEALDFAGFKEIHCYGSMAGEPFQPQTSPNLVIKAQVS